MSCIPELRFGLALLASSIGPRLAADLPSPIRLPNVNMVTPANGQVFPEGSNILLGANAPDDGQVLTLEFFADENKIGDAQGPFATPQGAWLLDWIRPPADTYLVTARATDDHGNVVTSAPVQVTVRSAPLSIRPASGLYQIISGTYSECCGIGGEFRFSLPNERQSFVRLTVDPQSDVVTMTFLRQDQQTVFGIAPCPPGDPIRFSFDYGFFVSDSIVFHVDPGPGPYHEHWYYTVSNSADALRIDGVVGIDPLSCADLPNQFSHSNVVAVLMPTAAIRVSEVEICWNAASNRTYQVQYRSALTSNDWINLGSPLAGNGSTNCITDKVPLAQPQRLYRVQTIP